LLVVVAHPDDETFGTGSVIADAAQRGVEVTVCCATRGEEGEDPLGVANGGDLGLIREQELRDAANILGARAVELLGYHDSGFEGPIPVGGLVAAPFGEVVDRLAEVIDRVAPDLVVTMDPEGNDPHRDHVCIGRAATEAFRRRARAGARLYWWCLLRERLQRVAAEHQPGNALDAYVDLEFGRPSADVTTVVDHTHLLDTRWAAIGAHRSQESPFAGMSEELAREFLASDHLIRIVPTWTGGPIETSLWDGLEG
jgi:LmbE family N-acetylglucosaminyl deacetylase